MHILSFAVDAFLTGYIVREVVRFVPRYRQLKQAIANGDAQARMRVYQRALVFEWSSALLALSALGFDWGKLNPKFLALEGSGLVRSLVGNDFSRGSTVGLLVGIAVGTVAVGIARFRANRRGLGQALDAPASWWHRLLPDFSALIPVTPQERFLWAAVAISAGICEETVFRGWLLATLHSHLGWSGTGLILAAAVVFGLAHAYQGISGMVLTALAGAFFCVLYVKTGSLLVPILIHCLVDLRFAVLAPRIRKTSASYA